MSIEVDISHRLGVFELNVRLKTDGGLIALFGPSGSGKTSLVNIIAGLTRPDRGRVAVDGAVLVDTERGIFVPPHRRRIGYVFQEDRLFPHLTVRQNLLYGRWFQGAGKRRHEMSRVVELLGVGHLLDRRPSRLSGGEKQRVAIGRALLSSPRLLLMDEPLASLDEPRKQEIMPYLERIRDGGGVPIVYVSHSVAEVARLANIMAVLSEGRALAVGPTVEIMQRLDLIPATGGEEAGAVIEATVCGRDDAYGLSILASRAGEWRVTDLDIQPGERLRMRIRARDVMIAREPPKDMSALNVLPAVVEEVSICGPIVGLKLDCNGEALVARLTRYSVEHLALHRGARVYAIVKSVSFDRSSLGAVSHEVRAADADAG